MTLACGLTEIAVHDAVEDAAWMVLDQAILRFEDAWRTSPRPELSQFLPVCDEPTRRRVLVELVKVDQEWRCRAGEPRFVEAYLTEWPDLRGSENVLAELLSAECLTRAVLGEMPSFRDLRSRFPTVCERIPLGRIRAEAENEKGERSVSLLQEQQVVRGTYEVDRLLGEGAFAEVYRVKHRFLGRQAMKVFKMVGMTIGEIEEMLGEALMLSRIGHPNIVRVFDANTTDTSRGMCGFFTMEYVAGGSLEQFWRSHGNRFVPVETAVDLIRQVCRGLAVAHDENPPIVHRDIKPQNVLVGYDVGGLRARLTDFGLAKHVNPLTLLASARGTRAFKPPEVFQDPQSDSCAGDVWALGSTLYLLLTDRLPYAESSDMDLLDDRSFQRTVIPPSRLNVQVDAGLDSIVYRSLAATPKERYTNAGQLLADLDRWNPRPARAGSEQKSLGADGVSKSALGQYSPANEDQARQMAASALKLSRQPNKLVEAADMMEEAFNKWPDLRERHEYQLKLWRRGVTL